MDLYVDDRTRLRGLREQDAPALFELVDKNRERLRRWLPWVDTTIAERDSLNFILATHKRRQEGIGLHTAIWHDDALCGVVGFNGIVTSHRHGEIGYWIAAEFEGKGLVTASCRALVTHGFDELDLHRIAVKCSNDNHRSEAIPIRLGFTYEGTLRDYAKVGDQYESLKIYSVLRDEWVR